MFRQDLCITGHGWAAADVTDDWQPSKLLVLACNTKIGIVRFCIQSLMNILEVRRITDVTKTAVAKTLILLTSQVCYCLHSRLTGCFLFFPVYCKHALIRITIVQTWVHNHKYNIIYVFCYTKSPFLSLYNSFSLRSCMDRTSMGDIMADNGWPFIVNRSLM